MSRPGRNDACPCGSGKKFKHCCALKKDSFPSGLIALLIVGALLAGLIVSVTSARSTNSGRVWSPEHGHYHDATGREMPR